jgi:hypothetical protein
MSDVIDRVRVLDVFVGTWNTTGSIRTGGHLVDQRLFATDIYEWLPGKCFLLHKVDARLGDEISRSVEVIGWDSEIGQITSTSYSDQGSISRFSCSFERGNWRIDGDAMRFRGNFDSNRRQLSGTWEIASETGWEVWMDVKLAKAD